MNIFSTLPNYSGVTKIWVSHSLTVILYKALFEPKDNDDNSIDIMNKTVWDVWLGADFY